MLGALPRTQAPQLATIAAKPPAGAEWLSEIKLDGYRLLVWLDGGRARLVTRNGHDWTPRMPSLTARFKASGAVTALIDGEMVALRPDGSSHFHDLQTALSAGSDGVLYFYAFDLLHLDGWDLRACSLRDRKRLLQGMSGWSKAVRYAEHIEGDPAALYQEACRLKLEGIICKRVNAPYRAGRSTSWIKVKCGCREEFVVLGWTPPGGSRQGIGGLALGFYDPTGRLHYAGSVGTGFSDQELLDMRARLEAMASAPPAALFAAGEEPDRQTRWVRPGLIAEVSFTAWSGEGRVRHPVYLGLREDKSAAAVVIVLPDPEIARREFKPIASSTAARLGKTRWKGAVPPLR